VLFFKENKIYLILIIFIQNTLGFGIWDLGFEVWDLGFGIWGLGFGVWDLGF